MARYTIISAPASTGPKALYRVGFFATWGRFPHERAPGGLQEVMFRRALLIMTVVFAGAACEELPEPKTPCRTEQECREQAKLCHYSCAHPRALKTCPKCCLDEERKCINCEGRHEFNNCKLQLVSLLDCICEFRLS